MRTRFLGLALVSALLLGACGGEEAPQTLSDTDHNEADVAFASDMVPHHAQALSMVDLTLDRPLDPEVEQLVEDIRAAQAPEIELMTDWLVEWGEEVPATMRDHVNAEHGDHGDHGTDDDSDGGTDGGTDGDVHGDMPGMMSADQMAELEAAPDADFQRLWLEMMVEHHEGAVAMAEAQQQEGMFRPAVELAEQIEEGQAAEIDLMRELLAG